jgi:hypothetical protein
MKTTKQRKRKALLPAWVKCLYCDEWWCTIHGCHTGEVGCTCPPIEEWKVDPYTEGGAAL